MTIARKSIKQSYSPSHRLVELMEEFRQMTNDSIRIAILNNASTMKKLSKLSYKELKRYGNVPSYYKLCAISRASGIISSMNKSIKRGHKTKDPYIRKPLLTSCYGFKIVNGSLRIPIGKKKFESIPLNKHTLKILEEDKSAIVKSFTLTPTSLSLCLVKQVQEIKVKSAIGIDRNLRNLTVGNKSKVTYYDMNKVVEIGETTKDIVNSFKRNDRRIRKEIASKYGKRRKARVNVILNKISKHVVSTARENNEVIVLEDITFIRSMYQRGNGQGTQYRRQLNNNWPFSEIKRQIDYKAAWEGVPVIHLTKSETRGTSSRCYQCGERLQGSKDNNNRLLWCKECEKWFDRDLVAVNNISYKGWVRFAHSKGVGKEAVVSERVLRDAPLTRKVDPTKLFSLVARG